MTARHHLIIAGTGRSGTSFLVRFLTALGLDTTLSRHGETGNWSDKANAGLENMPLVGALDQAPYVIKSPWVGEFIDHVLASDDIVIDALVVPMRDLVEAASSRSIVEHQAVHQHHPWMADDLDATWEVFGWTPGGSVFSLNPLDQARLLAVGFHRILHKAVANEVPLIMPAFPRMVEDWDYLYRVLKPVLPTDITPEQAREAHAAVASRSLVRVADELSAFPSPERPDAAGVAVSHYPAPAEVDNVALRREIRLLRRNSERLKDEVTRLEAAAACEPVPAIEPVPVVERGPVRRLAAALRRKFRTGLEGIRQLRRAVPMFRKPHAGPVANQG